MARRPNRDGPRRIFSPHYISTCDSSKFPSPDYDGHSFWCEAQRVRFDKAWNILAVQFLRFIRLTTTFTIVSISSMLGYRSFPSHVW